jgi:hypothetical protein
MTNPTSIAVDATSVYWTDSGGNCDSGGCGRVMKVSLAGGAPTTLASGLPYPHDIAVDATNVYWTDSSAIMKAPLNGGIPTTLASGQSDVGYIAIDATNAYWTDGNVGRNCDGGLCGTVMKAPLAGGTPVALASGLASPGPIAADSTSVYWITAIGLDTGISEVVAMRVSLAGGPPTTLASDLVGGQIAIGIAVDGTGVYETVNDMVKKFPLGGGTAATLASAEKHPTAIAVDATSVYWTDEGDFGPGKFGIGPPIGNGTIMKMPLSGGAATTLASGQNVPVDIAVDATSVYWVVQDLSGTSGAVMKLTPK